MRSIVHKRFWPNETAGRFLPPEVEDFAALHAAISETLRHFDDQLRAAEQELEILRVLHSVSVAATCEISDRPENDNPDLGKTFIAE
jgi:hypothetical protein